MKPLLAAILISSQVVCFTAPIYAAQAKPTVWVKRPEDIQKIKQIEKINTKSINLNIDKTQKQSIKTTKPVEKIDGKLFKSKENALKLVFEEQKKSDIEDIEKLWESTVERNDVIKFAVKKLALPPEQRRIHSSLMARSVSALISGASLMPGILGVDRVLSSAAAAGGSLTSRAIRNKSLPKEMPLTDTELIQLAGLVEELQNKIIKSYYDYKGNLESLRVCRGKIVQYNTDFFNSLKTKNSSDIIVTSSLYDKQLIEEIKLEQKVKLHRLELERLAGADIVKNLNLTKVSTYTVNNVVDTISSSAKITGGCND